MTDKDITKAKVAVLSGGWSDEREVSFSSAREVTHALGEAGFSRVDMLDIAAPDFVETLVRESYDVAFVALHGRYGEDGCIQGLLEIMRIPYTFSGVLASAVSMDKASAKAVYRRAGIPVAEDATIPAGVLPSPQELEALVERLGLPLFVKPSGNGSSFGISRVTTAQDLPAAIERAQSPEGSVIVEQAVEGTEITVPVIGNADARALPIIEIVTGAEFYDEKVKYEPSELHHVIPARIPEDAYARAQELAVEAHGALGCRGCSRSDFIVRADGTPVILETNSIPGMTAASLLPDSARRAGIEFPELCRYFVELALEGEGDA